MATHLYLYLYLYSTLVWKISWTEEPGGLQSMGSLRVRHDCSLPGSSVHGIFQARRVLEWGLGELDTTEQLHLFTYLL